MLAPRGLGHVGHLWMHLCPHIAKVVYLVYPTHLPIELPTYCRTSILHVHPFTSFQSPTYDSRPLMYSSVMGLDSRDTLHHDGTGVGDPVMMRHGKAARITES